MRGMRRAALSVMASALAMVLLAALLLPLGQAQAQNPQPGTVVGIATYTLAAGQLVSGTTGYSDSPQVLATGLDVSLVAAWQAADVFIDAVTGPTSTVTVTVQFSPDGALWVDGYELYPSWDVSGTATLNRLVYQTVVDAADGSGAAGVDVLRVPIAGEYMRVKIDATAESTVTVKSTLRNN